MRQFLFVMLILMVTAFGWQGCMSADSNAAEEKPRELTNVRTRPVIAGPFTEYFNCVGVVKPLKEVTLSFETGGQIENLTFAKGDAVTIGQTLAEINKDMVQAAHDEAKAGFELAELNFNRTKGLYEEQTSISQSEYDTAKLNYNMARARFDRTQSQLAKATIKSPINGVIVDKFIEEGELAAPGAPLTRILDISSVKIEVGIPENDIAFFQIGTPALLTFDAFPDEEFYGKIRFLSDRVDTRNRTIPAEIELPNPENKIKPEMIAKVRLVKKEYDRALVIPRDAIVETENGKAVFVVENGIAHLNPVILGPSYEKDVLIRSGLAENEALIIVGQRDVVDSEEVRIMNDETAPGDK